MKTALKGRLSETPELKAFTGKNGKEFFTTKFALFVPDPKSRKENGRMVDTPFKCTAFGETAEEICKNYKKGDMFCGVAEMRADHWEDRNGKMHKDMIWNFTAIDPEQQLSKWQTRTLTAFSKGDVEIGELMQSVSNEPEKVDKAVAIDKTKEQKLKTESPSKEQKQEKEKEQAPKQEQEALSL